ncbi:MAG: hypothetical protein CBD16_03505 [Betaproteobacteria bacterium TMED156]|nr:MAG: hypothetical protein CBD16_03505 [Betaproteobacteria bacterium TMED156]
MSINYSSNDHSSTKSNKTLPDPLADHKIRARQRLIGSIFFSFFVFFLSIVLLRDKPRSFVEDLTVKNSYETDVAQKIENGTNQTNSKLNLSLRDKRIIEISNSPVWMVRVGIFKDKEKAQDLKTRLILEGKPVILVPSKIGDIFVFHVKVGPYTQELAEKFFRQALSRGLDADIDRL